MGESHVACHIGILLVVTKYTFLVSCDYFGRLRGDIPIPQVFLSNGIGTIFLE